MASSTVAAQAKNYGASINIISGIQGVSPGGQASINMNVSQRIHREIFQCAGIMYRTPTVAFTGGGGTGATGTVLVQNGVVTAVVVTAGGTGYTTPPTVVITDNLYTRPNGTTVRVGQGATATATVGSGAVTAVTVTGGGTVSDIPPELFFTSQKRLVNGIIMRDISVLDQVRIQMANGLTPLNTGEYSVFFTEPWRRIVDHDQATAWDLIGQNTYQILLGISSALSSPSLNGVYEFDYLRNARSDSKGNPVLFLRPIKQHTLTYNVPQGVYNVTNIPLDYPLQRLWMYETGAGSITQIELYQDGNKVMEGVTAQILQGLNQYGFNTAVFDFPVVFDPDQRLGKALKVQNLVLRVYSAAPTALNIVCEIQADNYA